MLWLARLLDSCSHQEEMHGVGQGAPHRAVDVPRRRCGLVLPTPVASSFFPSPTGRRRRVAPDEGMGGAWCCELSEASVT
ncbi:hypothetical protein XAP412_970070 [Xanthomonas phaseoli pv. phaseoli]|uniref:Uncharacterized protein n=1 Tax=Xanthomonas campestris pv. phaseoli TaxID=317013 RepID=A0AB38E7L9_XANCH|nr:hypothetical protein XAP6984_1000069 [Xanthomonas phaseoli pv. phaseoli]SON92015.1 hypothetical protein XAP412_970070 [Xanthomonas phaseoli pv. phaseoli]SON93265.1 hypothetical protein XAP7430_990070 [Xanthomonas phaseoli pv. phaseoli]